MIPRTLARCVGRPILPPLPVPASPPDLQPSHVPTPPIHQCHNSSTNCLAFRSELSAGHSDGSSFVRHCTTQCAPNHIGSHIQTRTTPCLNAITPAMHVGPIRSPFGPRPTTQRDPPLLMRVALPSRQVHRHSTGNASPRHPRHTFLRRTAHNDRAVMSLLWRRLLTRDPTQTSGAFLSSVNMASAAERCSFCEDISPCSRLSNVAASPRIRAAIASAMAITRFCYPRAQESLPGS